MNLNLKIKPYTEIKGKGTKKDALYHLYHSLGMLPYANCYSSTLGSVQKKSFTNNDAWVYTIQVFKRGKWRKDKHYVIKVYRVPEAVLRYFRIKLHQQRNGVRIERY